MRNTNKQIKLRIYSTKLFFSKQSDDKKIFFSRIENSWIFLSLKLMTSHKVFSNFHWINYVYSLSNFVICLKNFSSHHVLTEEMRKWIRCRKKKLFVSMKQKTLRNCLDMNSNSIEKENVWNFLIVVNKSMYCLIISYTLCSFKKFIVNGVSTISLLRSNRLVWWYLMDI